MKAAMFVMDSYLVNIMIVMCYLVCHKCYAFSCKCSIAFIVNEHNRGSLKLFLNESVKNANF